jgi:hypothetical protein
MAQWPVYGVTLAVLVPNRFPFWRIPFVMAATGARCL